MAINYKNRQQTSASTSRGATAQPGKPAGGGRQGRNRQAGGGSIAAADNYGTRALNERNFNDTNDYLSQLWGSLQGANLDEGLNYLRNFLGADGASSAAGGGGARGGGYTGATQTVFSVPTGGSFNATYGGGGGQIPDTMQQSSWVNDRIKEMWDAAKHPENDPTLQPYIDTLKKQAMQAAAQERGALDARAEGSGRLGSGYYALQTANDAKSSGDALDAALAGTMMNARQQNMDRAMHGFDTADQNNLAAMQDLTNRADIAARAATAGQGTAAQLELARRGQDLDAINSLLGMHQFGLGLQNTIGNELNDVQGNALGAATNRYSSNNSLRAAAMGANAERYASDNSLAASRYASDMGFRGTQAQVGLQRYMYNDQKPQNSLDSLLRTILGVGGAGGTTWGQGPPPYGQFNPMALLQGMTGG